MVNEAAVRAAIAEHLGVPAEQVVQDAVSVHVTQLESQITAHRANRQTSRAKKPSEP